MATRAARTLVFTEGCVSQTLELSNERQDAIGENQSPNRSSRHLDVKNCCTSGWAAYLLGVLSQISTPLLVTVGLPQATMQNLGGCVVHLLPAMEAATLAQRAHCVRECMMDLPKLSLQKPWKKSFLSGSGLTKFRPRHIVEEHLIPAVLPTQPRALAQYINHTGLRGS